MDRIAIVGSRDWPYHEALRVEAEIRAFVESLPRDTVIVSGGARGVDTWAEQSARNAGLAVVLHLASKYVVRDAPRHLYIAALFRRNDDIAADCTRLEAWSYGDSRGTAHVVTRTLALGKAVNVHRSSPDGGDTVEAFRARLRERTGKR